MRVRSVSGGSEAGEKSGERRKRPDGGKDVEEEIGKGRSK